MNEEDLFTHLERDILRRRSKYGIDWRGLDDRDEAGNVTHRGANLFFLGSINDIYEKFETTWHFAERFVNELAPDPDKIWHFIVNDHGLHPENSATFR